MRSAPHRTVDAFDPTSARIAEACLERRPKRRGRHPTHLLGVHRIAIEGRADRLDKQASIPSAVCLNDGENDSDIMRMIHAMDCCTVVLSTVSACRRRIAISRGSPPGSESRASMFFTCGEQKTGREFPTGLPAVHLHRERSSPGETIDEQSPAPADNSLQPATVTVPFIKGAVTREHRRPT